MCRTKRRSNVSSCFRKVNVFCTEKLERHHIVPLGSVKKIGESTQALRTQKENIANSPLNYVYITNVTNNIISDMPLKDYENAIIDTAKASLNIANYPCVDELSNIDKMKKWLQERHKSIKGVIRNRIDHLLDT